MTTAPFLFELVTEDLPAKTLPLLEHALLQEITSRLKKAELHYEQANSFATPRRLAVIIHNLQKTQPTQRVERRGPALEAAYDKAHNPTQAALRFAESCETNLENLSTIKTEKGEWLYFSTERPGQTAEALLPEIVNESIKALPIKKLMYWGKGTEAFVRPVQQFTLLLGKDLIETRLFGLANSSTTLGHRFHAPQAIHIDPENYEKTLFDHFVMADFAQRKNYIAEQVHLIAAEHNAKPVITEELLDEVTGLVEWPEALLGTFDPAFLKAPKEALILSMQQNQKYFALLDQNENLLPFFITIANIKSKDKNQVIKGNERVMRARLADALFFFEQDKKTPLANRLPDLSHILFQKELGSLKEKTDRVRELSHYLAMLQNADPIISCRAAELSKTDLLTNMVNEFPELQGTMGRYYASHDKENPLVAIALEEQYLPRFSGDTLPTSITGQILAVADRVDTLTGIFGIHLAPTGDKDPFGLRRAALGIIRILIEKNLSLDLKPLIAKSIELYGSKISNPSTLTDVLLFCQERLRSSAIEQGYSADLFSAVAARQISTPLDFILRLNALKHFLNLPEANNLVGANKRVTNLLNKNPITSHHIDESLLTEKEEIALYQTIKEKKAAIDQLDYIEIMTTLAALQKPVDHFFENVMVITDNEAIRHNRLALLSELRNLFNAVADISLLQQDNSKDLEKVKDITELKK